MMKNRFLLIALVLGLSILPSIIVGSGFADLQDNESFMDPIVPTHKPHKLNATEMATKRRERIIARKKFAKDLQRMTIPFLDTLERIPTFLKELGATEITKSKQMTNQTGLMSRFKQLEEKPMLYARLVRALVLHIWNNTWGSYKKGNSTN